MAEEQPQTPSKNEEERAAELEALKQRVAGLELQLEREAYNKKRLDAIIASVPGIVWESRGNDVLETEANIVSDYVLPMTGYSPEEWQGTHDLWLQIMHPDDRERVIEESQIMFQQGGGSTQYRWITKDGRTIWVETHETVIKDEAGSPIGLRGVSLDITARKAAEEEQLRLHNELIQVQASTLAELSTPLIPISDRVLVMPLIGAIDSARAERVITALLHGIGAARAHIAIIDITGVPVVDSQVADALVRAARSVRLLGAEVVLTGIRPEVAQTLVSIAADLSGITTLGTLQSGIAYAMERR